MGDEARQPSKAAFDALVGCEAAHFSIRGLCPECIDRAIERERERCAAIAEGFKLPEGRIAVDTGMIWRHSTASDIAAAIRR